MSLGKKENCNDSTMKVIADVIVPPPVKYVAIVIVTVAFGQSLSGIGAMCILTFFFIYIVKNLFFFKIKSIAGHVKQNSS